jgi:phosphinothricin acetyltransferase
MADENAGRAPADPDEVEIQPGTESDLPRIVEILNYAAANSVATLAERPTSVAERRE